MGILQHCNLNSLTNYDKIRYTLKGSDIMALSDKQSYTVDDYDSFPEDLRAEIIDGQIYYQAAPSRSHQEILMYLSQKIANYIDSKGGPCKIYPAPFAVKLNEDDKTVVEPDISVICDRDKLDDRGCNGAPDWIIEINSPSNSSRDYVLKLNKYMAAGVREYWIVDPKTKAITVYFFESEIFAVRYTFQDSVKVNIYNDLTIDFSQLDI